MVPHQKHRPLVGNVAEAADLATEPDARHQPHQRQALANEVWIALVQVRARNSALRLLGYLSKEAVQQAGLASVAASVLLLWYRGAAVAAGFVGDPGPCHELMLCALAQAASAPAASVPASGAPERASALAKKSVSRR